MLNYCSMQQDEASGVAVAERRLEVAGGSAYHEHTTSISRACTVLEEVGGRLLTVIF